MNVRMVLQVLAPGMEHRDEADLSTEVARIGGDRAQCFGCGPEQDGVDRGLVLERDFGGRRRQGPCCMDQWKGRTHPYPVLGHAMRTDSGRPSSSMRLRTWTATFTSVARR